MQSLLEKVSVRELHLALIGFGATVTVAAVVAVLLPNVKLMTAVDRQLKLLADASQDGGELERLLQKQRLRIDDLKFRLHGDMVNLPVREMESYIIGRLQRVSWNNQVELVSVAPASGERIQIFQEILFNVQLVGQYGDLHRWLLDMRKELGFVVVKKYSLTRHNNHDAEPLLRAKLSLASYRAVQ
jgi:Tfp pilus assembly protein PilO